MPTTNNTKIWMSSTNMEKGTLYHRAQNHKPQPMVRVTRIISPSAHRRSKPAGSCVTASTIPLLFGLFRGTEFVTKPALGAERCTPTPKANPESMSLNQVVLLWQPLSGVKIRAPLRTVPLKDANMKARRTGVHFSTWCERNLGLWVGHS